MIIMISSKVQIGLSRWAEIKHTCVVLVKSAKVKLREDYSNFTFRYIAVNFSVHLLTLTRKPNLVSLAIPYTNSL